MPRNLAKFLTPQNVVIAAAVISVLAVITAFVYTSRKPSASYEAAKTASITQEIDTTGSIKAADSLDLSFDVSGRIASIPVKVGQHVVAGQTLAALSAADLAANVSQAKAALSMQQAKLEGLKAGARPEDLAVSQTSVTGAQNGVAQSKQSLLSSAQDAYVMADDAVHNRVDLVFDNPRSAQPHLTVTFSDPQVQINVVSDRVSMEATLKNWQSFLASQSANTDTATLVATTRSNIAKVSAFLDEMAAGLSTVTPSAYLTTATVQSYQSSVATARTNVSASLSAVNTASTAEQTAETALASAQSQYALKQAGALPTDIQAQEAAVQSAQAAVDLASAQLGKTVVRAPIAGTVARNDAHLGETASPGVSLITVDSDAQFQIESYVSEADVSKIIVGQKAQVRIDAYPGADFSASVIAVDPAATMQNGVAAYKVTFQFDVPDTRIKAGLTANARIISSSKDNALTVPTSAVIMRGSDHYVLKRTNGADQLVKVQTGIVSADGMTEILSGISAGDSVRSFGNQY